VNLEGLSVEVPRAFTWSVTLAGAVDGIMLHDEPMVGSSFSDFWEKRGGIWETLGFNRRNGAAS
jgi:hypothetical protein